MRDVHRPLLFEVAWEVANKVGGIYTVLKTKAASTMQEYKERYCMIGPLSYKSAPLEVEPKQPETPELTETLKSMSERGVRYLYGTWLIDGAPTVLLFDVGSQSHHLNDWKTDLWNECKIPTPNDDWETNDAFCHRCSSQAMIAHFHEWLGSVALPLIRKRNIPIATIFTTHATLLGRYLCAGSADFYNNLDQFDVDHEAGKRMIYHRYCIERAATHSSDVFTTVSHITAYEAEHLLKRKPDGVLPNGLNVVKFSAVHEFQNLHAKSKQKLHEFVRGHFYGHLDFELDNTLYFFTAGRYEYRNKGVDMFIEALARLNARLKHYNSPITVVAFIVMPAASHSFTVEALKGQAVVKQLRETVAQVQAKIGERIFDSALRLNVPNAKDLLSEEEKVHLKRRVYALKRDTLPPITTHNMADDAHDPILNHIRHVNLFNAPTDRVKVIFHPEFINANNPLFGIDYDDFVRGCHLGVFPSYYEPWGYTPAECTVMGVPSITTNLSGFGCYMDELLENSSDYGIYIVDRRLKNAEESMQQLADQMMEFCQKSRRQRINQRNRTERISELLDWKRMGQEYVRARHLALRRAYPEEFEDESEEEEEVVRRLSRPLSVVGSPRFGSQPGSPRYKEGAPEAVKELLEGLNQLEMVERGRALGEED